MAKEKQELARKGIFDAIERTRAAAQMENPLSFFTGVAESLWWITTLDEALRTTHAAEDYETRRDSDPVGRVIPGLRYARDRLVHDAFATGMQSNPLLPESVPPPWRWRHLNDPELPKFVPQSPWGREVALPIYEDLLAESDILEILDKAASFLDEFAY